MLFLLAACSEKPGITKNVVDSVNFELTPLNYVDGEVATKTTISDNGSGFSFAWAADDVLGIYPDSGSQVYFTLESTGGTTSASFDGGGWEFKNGAKYYSYYPFIPDFYLDRTSIPVTFAGQVQNGVSNTAHIGKYFYMCTDAVSAESGTLSFKYQNLCSIFKIKATLPAGTYTTFSLKSTENIFIVDDASYSILSYASGFKSDKKANTISIDLQNFVLSSKQEANIYLVVPPMDLTGKTVSFVVDAADGTSYSFTATLKKAYARSTMYSFGISSWTTNNPNPDVPIGDWEDGETIDID